MEIRDTDLKGVLLIKPPTIFEDFRGAYVETYNRQIYRESGIDIDFSKYRQTADGSVEFTGPVTITWNDSLIQADRLTLRERRHVSAEGDVLIVWGGNRIHGRSMEYDLDEERGIVVDAIGSLLDDYIFWAESIEKIGDEKVRLKIQSVVDHVGRLQEK